MGELIVHVGDVGQGQLVKVINNAVAAANTAVVAEALVAGKLAGADLDALVTVIAGRLGRLRHARAEGRADARSRWSTLFKLEHMLKDLRLCLQEAEAVGADMELVETRRSCSPRPSARASGSGTSPLCSRS